MFSSLSVKARREAVVLLSVSDRLPRDSLLPFFGVARLWGWTYGPPFEPLDALPQIWSGPSWAKIPTAMTGSFGASSFPFTFAWDEKFWLRGGQLRPRFSPKAVSLWTYKRASLWRRLKVRLLTVS